MDLNRLKQHAAEQICAFRSNNCQTYLHLAVQDGNLEAVTFLTSIEGFEIDSKDENGATGLFLACKSGNLEICQHLVEHCGADVFLSTRNGYTTLMAAAAEGHSKVIDYLLEKVALMMTKTEKPMVTQSVGNTIVKPTHLSYESVRSFINAKTTDGLGHFALYLAVRQGRFEAVELLLSKYSKHVNAELKTDCNGWTALDVAKVQQDSAMIDLLTKHATSSHSTEEIFRTLNS